MMPRRSADLVDAPPPSPVQPDPPPFCTASSSSASAGPDPLHCMLDEPGFSCCSDDLYDISAIDPTEIYTLEDYIKEENVFDAWIDLVAVELKNTLEAVKAGPSYSKISTKRHMEKQHLEAQQRLASALREGTDHLTKRSAALSRQLFSPQKTITKVKGNGTGKAKTSISVIGEELEKFLEAQAIANHDRTKMLEYQQEMLSEKLKSAERERESKLLDLYNKLLVTDTTI
ncbi:hypothetical protein ACP4OV_020146 [Aristida adscensionis]